MNADIGGIIRTLLSAIGAYLIGKNVFGISVDSVLWQEATGFILAAIAFWWSIKDKEVTIEKIQGIIRQTITFLGGLFVAKGWVQDDMVVLVLAVVTTLLPTIYAYFSRNKSKQIEQGKISIAQLKK